LWFASSSSSTSVGLPEITKVDRHRTPEKLCYPHGPVWSPFSNVDRSPVVRFKFSLFLIPVQVRGILDAGLPVADSTEDPFRAFWFIPIPPTPPTTSLVRHPRVPSISATVTDKNSVKKHLLLGTLLNAGCGLWSIRDSRMYHQVSRIRSNVRLPGQAPTPQDQ
jgi:hypothetical protein